jgi:hypothetical protein
MPKKQREYRQHIGRIAVWLGRCAAGAAVGYAVRELLDAARSLHLVHEFVGSLF